MSKFSIRELMEAGFHFGHQTKRWNPKMSRYIFGPRNGVHIIDLQQSVVLLRNAYNYVRDTVAGGGNVLFVGTKRQAVEIVLQEAKRCNQFFINHRWLGGTLTNWQTIQGSIRRIKEIEKMKAEGITEALTKREVQILDREKEKMERALGGIRDMTRVPSVIVVVDTNKEYLAVREANKLGIPVVALVDTNCNPDPIDMVVPGNDDAIRSVTLFLKKMSDAAAEGMLMRKEMPMTGEEEGDAPASSYPEYDDEEYDEEMIEVQR